MIAVVGATGFATVQDLGWSTGRAMGLPRSGAMDPDALRLANLLVGNQPGAAAVEIALGGLTLTWERPVVLALVGAQPDAVLDGVPIGPGITTTGRAGATLRIRSIRGGRFTYLALRGGIDVPLWRGSRATYPPTGLGGLGGRALRSGDSLDLGDQIEGPHPEPGFAAPRSPSGARSGPIAAIPGPQFDRFDDDAHAAFETGSYVVTSQSNRMGTRLRGPSLHPRVVAAHPSEGTCVGAVQVPDDGQPIVILADGPTVGGYPKIGAVATVDLARLAQTPIQAAVRFRWVTVAEAQSALYQARSDLEATCTAIRAAAG